MRKATPVFQELRARSLGVTKGDLTPTEVSESYLMFLFLKLSGASHE